MAKAWANAERIFNESGKFAGGDIFARCDRASSPASSSLSSADSRNSGGNKPISDKQIELVKNIAEERDMNAEEESLFS